jgi:hypothetical protein
VPASVSMGGMDPTAEARVPDFGRNNLGFQFGVSLWDRQGLHAIPRHVITFSVFFCEEKRALLIAQKITFSSNQFLHASRNMYTAHCCVSRTFRQLRKFTCYTVLFSGT